MRRVLHLGLAVALGLTLAIASTAQAADEASVDLELADRFAFPNATLLLGTLDLGDPTVAGLEAVRVDGLGLPQGVLYVCPARSGQQGEIPPLPVLQERCRDEDRYEDPTLAVGSRTWLATRGNTTLPEPVAGTASLVWATDDGRTGWAGTLPDEDVVLTLEDDAYAFRPTRGSSEIVVEDDGERTHYNGTGWIFYLEATGTLSLAADGLHAMLPEGTPLTVSPAPLEAFRGAYDPRILLDLQDAVEGPDAREPTSNATGAFGSYGRIPHLVNGALLGPLEGRVGDRQLDRGSVSLVHIEEGAFEVEEGNLTGTATVTFTRSGEGLASGTGSPSDVPWWLIVPLWVAAAALLVLREAPARPGWHRWLGAASSVVVFLAWDLSFNALVGTSALGLIGEAPELGVLLAVLGFEVIALLVAWILVYLPARLALERGLPDRVSAWARPALTGLALLAVWLVPGTIVVLGQLVARL